MTSCGHSFCQRCIVPANPRPGWRCPLCNRIHDHPAEALARNFFAEQIVESFQAQTPQAPVRPVGEFGLCEIHQQDITLCESFSYSKTTIYYSLSLLMSQTITQTLLRLHKAFAGYVFSVRL